MLVLVNVSNQGQPLGDTTLKEVRAFGVDGVRTDILPDGAEAQLTEFRDNPDLSLLAIIHSALSGDEATLVDEARHAARIARENLAMHAVRHPPIFELGNEPRAKDPTGRKHKLWKDPERFGKGVSRAAEAIWKVMGEETLVISGGIHNPSAEEQEFLKKAAAHFPKKGGQFAVGFHNYAPGMGDPDKPQGRFKGVDEQMRGLTELGFPLFDTESGGHTAKPENHTDEEIAAWLKRRLELSKKWGVLGTVVFQLNDGPDANNYEHTFGLLRFKDHSWKPSAHALKEWIDANRKPTQWVEAQVPPASAPEPPVPSEPRRPKGREGGRR